MKMKLTYLLAFAMFYACSESEPADQDIKTEEAEEPIVQEAASEPEIVEEVKPEVQLGFDSRSCDIPGEIVVHPPKPNTENSYPIHHRRFFPVGVNKDGIFAYVDFNAEIDECDCVFTELVFYDDKKDTIVDTERFAVEGEDYEKFQDFESSWKGASEKFCNKLEDYEICQTRFSVTNGEELMTIAQLHTEEMSEEESMSPWPVVKFTINDDQIFAKSGTYDQNLDARLVAMLTYQVGEEYYHYFVVSTGNPGFEGSTIRNFRIYTK